MRKSSRCIALILVAWAGFLLPTGSALEFDDGGVYDPARHDRFVPGSFPGAPEPNPTFLLSEYEGQLAGIGWQTDQPSKKAALVSPRHFLNADHYRLARSISFRGADGVVRSYPIERNQQVYQDVAIGTLSEPIPPAHGVPFFATRSGGATLVGRNVFYLGKPPSGNAFAVGRTVIWYATLALAFNRQLVPDAWAIDRVRGASGDSGGPTLLLEGGELLLLGHHYFSTVDYFLGHEYARAAVDDHLAADGHLLDVAGEGRLGEPADGGLVVTRVDPDGTAGFALNQADGSALRRLVLHGFSGAAASVRASVSRPEFGLVDPASGATVDTLDLALPADASGVGLELEFVAPGWGLFVDVLEVTAGSLTVSVPLSAAVVDLGLSVPELTISPASQTGLAGPTTSDGDVREYAVGVTNLDAAGNPAATFDLGTVRPSAWTASVSPSSLQLAPGESGTATLAVAPAAGAEPGAYEVSIEISNSAQPIHSTSASATYEVLEDTTPPSAPTGLGASGNNKRTTLSWSASNDDVAVVGYEMMRDGALLGTTDKLSYADASVERDVTYAYTVRAYDFSGNVSPNSDVLLVRNGVAVGSGGGGGGTCVGFQREVGKRCRDGIDNDCDGLIDGADPDC